VSIEGLDRVIKATEDLRSLLVARLTSLFLVQGEAISPEDRVKIAHRFVSEMRDFGAKLQKAVDDAESRLEQFAGKHGVQIPNGSSSSG
jgi:hypothetical protein